MGTFRIACVVMPFLAIAAGCSTPKVMTQSRWNDAASTDTTGSHVDVESGVRWWLANDGKNAYFSFEAYDRATVMAIVQDGFTVYFDTTGKNKRTCSVSFGNKAERPVMDQIEHRPGSPPGETAGGGMPSTHTGRYNRVVWKGIVIDPELEKTDFIASYTTDTAGKVRCNATIPLRMVDLGNSSKSFTMGLVISVRDRRVQHNFGGPQQQGGPGGREGAGGARPSMNMQMQATEQGINNATVGMNAPLEGWGGGNAPNESKTAEIRADIWFSAKLIDKK